MQPVLLVVSLSLLALVSADNKDYQKRWYAECGTSQYVDAGAWDDVNAYIVNGRKARSHEFPWAVSLQDRNSWHYCGAVLIHPQWALTAAHCMVAYPVSNFDIVVGLHDMGDKSAPRRAHAMEAYFLHHNYGKLQWFDTDVTLIRLKEPVALSADVQPICAPNPDNLYVDYRTVIAGWGSTTSDYYEPAQQLLWINTTVTTNTLCEKDHGNWDLITENMICAGDTPDYIHDSCQGDSGGPMFVRDENGHFELTGLVSWGTACAYWAPGVYARVGNFLDWIDTIMARY